MLDAALALYALVSLGLLALALRYGVGAVPLGYHAEILARDGAAPGANARLVLGALYRTLAGALAAMALLVAGGAALTLEAAPAATAGLIFAATLLAGVPAALVPRRVEVETGVRTPWRASLALVAVSALAGALALAG